MNLRKMIFWKHEDSPRTHNGRNPRSGEVAEPGKETRSESPARSGARADAQQASTATVIPLPLSPAAPSEGDDEFTLSPAQAARLQGLMNTLELEAFFRFNHFGSGRHQGSQYRTLEALERGLDAAVAQFQNIVLELRGRRQIKLDRLQLARQEVASLSTSMADQLTLACQHTERELAALQEQFMLAEQRKGWVLDALNRYRLGFDRGVRDALDYELLNA